MTPLVIETSTGGASGPGKQSEYGQPASVVVDWGTTSFRLWSLDAQSRVLDRASGPSGMSTLAPHEFEAVLENNLTELAVGGEVPVVACGMVGARQGWCEAPYVQAPTLLTRLGQSAIRVPDVARDVRIVPGVMQTDPANVMRGEETQLLGLLQQMPDFDGVVGLPGTHCKWVVLKLGRIEQFVTCMTGELFSLLSSRSVLKHSMAGDGWDQEAYRAAVAQSMAEPSSVASSLFSLRAETLLADLTPDAARARLSGMLVGLELAVTCKLWQGAPVALIGAESLCVHYAEALALNDVQAQVLDNEAMTLGGLVSVAGQMRASDT